MTTVSVSAVVTAFTSLSFLASPSSASSLSPSPLASVSQGDSQSVAPKNADHLNEDGRYKSREDLPWDVHGVVDHNNIS
jgi:exo-beta-1,3-glucanase (GH17 family)